LGDCFGDLLRGFRVAASLTQEVLAERCGISPATVAALEQGRRRAPRLSTVRLIATALGVSAAELGALAEAASGGTVTGAAPRTGTGTGDRDGISGRHARSGRAGEPGALPVPITPLFGRRAAAAAVAQLLSSQRLVTLTGPGGVGKTRLAVQVAGDMLADFPGGVYWVDLSLVSDGAGVADAVLQSIRPGQPLAAPVSDLGPEALPRDRLLVVIDGCEHLLEATAELIAGLLVHRSVTVLATSREHLALLGEIRWPVPALGVPPRWAAPTAAGLTEAPSAALFVERARRACPRYCFTDADPPAVDRICRRLDGLPLALELAAARIGSVTPRQLADELDEHIPLAVISARGVPGRHRTLRASIDWSYCLLTRAEQAAFRCLAYFEGAFDAAAFAGVTVGAGAADSGAAFSILCRLADKSLVLADAQRGQYRVLETIRAFAIEQAAQAGELAGIHDAHASYYTQWLSGLHASAASEELPDLAGAGR
jgi:predicted ATPase/transcriptional regulator with XRE-family HTH domain